MAAPKVFISYSWTTPDHEAWVLQLATDLVECGVQAVLDKWDLREGHDAYQFMEQMVTDEEITKVIIVSDRRYAEKANSRSGGVGTETQVMTPDIYGKRDQTKFVVVIPPPEEDGAVHVPVFYKNRIHIDLSDSEKRGEQFEALLRWIVGKPVHRKPELGRLPDYLNESDGVSLGTGASAHYCLEAIRTGKAIAGGALEAYFSTFLGNLDRFRLPGPEPVPDEAVVKSLESLAPYKDEWATIVGAVAQYAANPDMTTKIHRFFEKLADFLDPPEDHMGVQTWACDNFRFMANELLLIFVALYIRHERFELLRTALVTPFFLKRNPRMGDDAIVYFDRLQRSVTSFAERGRRLGRTSALADLFKQRTEAAGKSFDNMLQADLVLFLVSKRLEQLWWPETLLYASRRAMEIFARSKSKSYFQKIQQLLGVDSPLDFGKFIKELEADPRGLPRWPMHRLSVRDVVGLDAIATMP